MTTENGETDRETDETCVNIKLTRVEIIRNSSHGVQQTGLQLGLSNHQQEVNLKQRREIFLTAERGGRECTGLFFCTFSDLLKSFIMLS